MPYSLILLNHRFVSLAIFVGAGCVAALVEEIFGLVEIFLVACHEVELGKSHLCNLMARNAGNLVRTIANLAANTVGIFDCDVEEISLSCGLIVCYRAFHHVAEVIKLMAEVFHHFPAF